MAKFLIEGGRKLDGCVSVESAKNAVLPMMAAAVLAEDEVVIQKCPKILDVIKMAEILRQLGCKIKFEDDSLLIDSSDINNYAIPKAPANEIRSSVILLGALLGCKKRAEAYRSGGCNIGKRPIDLHIYGFNKLGIKTSYDGEKIILTGEEILGNTVNFSFPSVGATENVILCAVKGKGRTVIKNPAKEPEIVDLINFLNKMGAKISGAGTDEIVIEGVKKLHGVSYTPIGDRIEAGTYILAAAATGGSITVKGVKYENFLPLITKLVANNCTFKIFNDIIQVKSCSQIKGCDFYTGPHPAFPTDLQAPMAAYLATASGVSHVKETLFETRFKYCDELVKMGANIKVDCNTAIIYGAKLHGARVVAPDLRGGAALCIAALSAAGQTVVDDIYHIERGYLNMANKMQSLGAEFKRVT